MPDGPGGFTQDYSCPALLRIPRGRRGLRVRNCHPLRLNFPGHSPRRRRAARRGPTTPRVRRHTRGLGSSPFARHYWGNHCYFLLLRVLRCFSSPGSPPGICRDDRPSGGRVVPFGNPRINGHLRLPRAYRSLSRPSSPPRAKASTRRPNLLSPWTPQPAERPAAPAHTSSRACNATVGRREGRASSLYSCSLVCQHVKERVGTACPAGSNAAREAP